MTATLTIPAYGWDDVEDPTEAELAEVDEALAAQPPSPTDELELWSQNVKVRLAMEVAGLPDSEPGWLERFTRALFAITEAAAEHGIDELAEAITQFENLPQEYGQIDLGLSRQEWAAYIRGVRASGTAAVIRFLSHGWSMVETARLLRTTPRNVAHHTTRGSAGDLDAVVRADGLLRDGMAYPLVVEETGLSYQFVGDYARRFNLRVGRFRPSGEMVDRALELWRENGNEYGKGTTHIASVLSQEFGEEISKHRVHKWIARYGTTAA